jgi:hypothetical protein
MKRVAGLLVAGMGILGCGLELPLSDTGELSLRPEGAWTGKQLDAAAHSCEAWARVMRPGRSCRIDPNGRIVLAHSSSLGVWVRRHELPPRVEIGPVTEPEDVGRMVLHAVPLMAGFAEDDHECAASSVGAPWRQCWERISAIDVERCRDAGEC